MRSTKVLLTYHRWRAITVDYDAYQRAINQGFSERQATKIGEDAWEENRWQEHKRNQEPELDYSKQYQEYCEAQYLEHKIEILTWFLEKVKSLNDNSEECSGHIEALENIIFYYSKDVK